MLFVFALSISISSGTILWVLFRFVISAINFHSCYVNHIHINKAKLLFQFNTSINHSSISSKKSSTSRCHKQILQTEKEEVIIGLPRHKMISRIFRPSFSISFIVLDIKGFIKEDNILKPFCCVALSTRHIKIIP